MLLRLGQVSRSEGKGMVGEESGLPSWMLMVSRLGETVTGMPWVSNCEKLCIVVESVSESQGHTALNCSTLVNGFEEQERG